MRINRPALAALALGLVAPGLSACSVAGADDADDVVTIGYQSKTINTVTAGTLLRELGYFEDKLEEIDPDLEVDWQDYDTGAPITAEMLAGKIDIGSMGDYPLLINGSRAGTGDDGDSMIAVTGYNPHGALNGVVVGADSEIEYLTDLEGKSISASVGSAGHGTLVQALEAAGIHPTKDVAVENQDPPVGASSLQGGSVDAVSQFVAWPGLLAFRDNARLVYDGGRLDLPTLHGTVVRNEFLAEEPAIAQAFVEAQVEATDYLHDHPLEAAEIVAEETGLPVEVVYLYNGRNGVSTFDPTINDDQVAALEHDLPFLESIGVLEDPLDLEAFVDPSVVEEVYGAAYDAEVADRDNPAAITGTDEVCGTEVTDPALAGEIWVEGEDDTRPTADPVCLLRNAQAVLADGGELRAAYVPDALTGTRWFADRMIWLRDGDELLPFATRESADDYAGDHSGTRELTWDQALEQAGDLGDAR
ncbi:NitT/TauT family transport system substrate-binding protein [Nocardioides thalensis]|uniref:NitT/TauT family transport system substrate-binding protein n=1 Tax=Nocardioides thalensis TaxID=1914755 RepID=A0A853C016_9ACTN|nr:ABC transporter substrate-binding protein [Nocardioides thalensis]NYJ00614.1 NitT/TauT family transport system substrate-binding protein [Nocardioides thalensis]